VDGAQRPTSASTKTHPLDAKKNKEDKKTSAQEEMKGGEYYPPAMFYSARSPQRNASPHVPPHDGPRFEPYSPNIFIEPPSILQYFICILYLY
jgi:hypothetical protein